ncbi:MAG: type II secretion system F family protein [Gammaproteobacteria bacterium]|nr:type II secretion system F family protein [Gammaproteobacteria bacterium]MBU1558519.1 type II secretion system F family protein [Gammaproteobacteria bacterium]MBU1926159.1 type II secretion system F family protein [Gammaproteobacteria bacterium]MBU2545598.1 type II secretion system F family protein [Gammaproteobacteria bacterium]
MTIYQYSGRDNQGKIIQGTVDSSSTEGVVKFLAAKEVTPIQIESLDAQKRPFGELNIELTTGKVKPKELMNFCEQMATLLEAGVPVIGGLQQLAKSTKTKTMKNALSEIAEGIIAGKTFTDMLREYPKIFSPIFISIIHVGEDTGNLDVAFSQLTKFIENAILNRKRLVSAVRYPLIVISAILVAMVVMNFFVIPKFALIFSSFGKELPLPTRILIESSNFLTTYWVWLLIFIIGVIIGIRYALTKEKIRYAWDKYKLRFPLFGNLQLRIMLSQFTWVLSLVLRAGVPIIEGITTVAGAADNLFVQKKILEVKDSIEQGESFSQSITRAALFNEAALQIIAVGEETGRLDEVLGKVARYYEREVDYDIRRLNDYVEPVLLAIVGLMVVMLALGVYLPMWDMIQFAHIG